MFSLFPSSLKSGVFRNVRPQPVKIYKVSALFNQSGSNFVHTLNNTLKQTPIPLQKEGIESIVTYQKRDFHFAHHKIVKKNQNNNQMMWVVTKRKVHSGNKSSKTKYFLIIVLIVVVAYAILMIYNLQSANFPEFDPLFSDPETTNKSSRNITAIMANEIFQIIINNPEKYQEILPYINNIDGIDIEKVENKYVLGKFGSYFNPTSISRCIINSRMKISTGGSQGNFNGLLKLRGVMSPDAHGGIIIAVKDFNISLEPNEPDQKVKQFIFVSNEFDESFLQQTMLVSKQVVNSDENPGLYLQFVLPQ